MNGPLLLTLLLIVLVVLLISKMQSAPPGTPWSWASIWHVIKHGPGASAAHLPRSREYLAENIPRSWPIRTVLIMANEELRAMHQTLNSAQAVQLPDHIIHSYDDNMRRAGRLLNRNSDRIVQAARTGPVSPQLGDALNRKQESLQHLLDALQTARGSLAAIIVTGLEDQRDVDRVARSLQAWSDALSEVSADTANASLPRSVNEV